jgi:ADP-heptose:LPS heptosyltransferase
VALVAVAVEAGDPGLKILVMARDAMGDLVNTTGAVASLARKFPEAAITVESGGAGVELFAPHRVWVRQRGAKLSRVARIFREKFDLGVVFDNSHDYARILRLARVPRVVGCHKGTPELFTESVAFDPNGHDMFPILEGVLGLLGAEYGGPELPTAGAQPLPPAKRAGREGVAPGRSSATKIAIHTSATHPAKTWPRELWDALIPLLPALPTVSLGPGDEPIADLPCVRPKSLAEFAHFLAGQDLLIVGDTGPAHLAAAVGTPTVILYGGTPPRRGHPWGDQWNALYHPTDCAHYEAGCAFLASGLCSQTCMRKITPKEVAEKVREVLNPS